MPTADDAAKWCAATIYRGTARGVACGERAEMGRTTPAGYFRLCRRCAALTGFPPPRWPGGISAIQVGGVVHHPLIVVEDFLDAAGPGLPGPNS